MSADSAVSSSLEERRIFRIRQSAVARGSCKVPKPRWSSGTSITDGESSRKKRRIAAPAQIRASQRRVVEKIAEVLCPGVLDSATGSRKVIVN